MIFRVNSSKDGHQWNGKNTNRNKIVEDNEAVIITKQQKISSIERAEDMTKLNVLKKVIVLKEKFCRVFVPHEVSYT